MEPEARYTLIGSVVLALIAATALALMWLSGAGAASGFHYYTIYFERQSLEGLQVGGDVNMRGVKVGRVETFEIQRDNINRVSVNIRVDKRTPVSINSQAVVNRNLVTGIARIDLNTEQIPGPPLTRIPPGQVYPVITEGTGDLDAITDSASALIKEAEKAVHSINDVLSAQNRAALGGILASLKQTTSKLDSRLDTFERAAGSIEKTALAFDQTATGIGNSLNTLGRSLGPITKEAGKVLKEMRFALREISQTARSVERSTQTLSRRADDVADVGVTELRATARDLRHGVDLLSRTLDRLQDPRAALLGPGEAQLGPGENR